MFSLTRSSQRGSSRATALVLVLSCVALVAVLVVAFLSSVSTDLQSSKVYSNGSAVKLLSQTAVNMVIGQIRVATADPTLDWASQPGMIRTYGTSGTAATGYYKLYSDDSMQGPGGFNQTLATNTVPTDWFSRKGIYTDLNRPVTVDGTNSYPIVDGDFADMTTYTPSSDVGKVSTLGVTNVPTVSGYWLSSSTPIDSTSPNQAPMPVKWLYQLQGGQIIEPDPTLSAGGSVTFAKAAAQPSQANPIVGRMAFWTDDECAKVNINTASEGTPWTTPHTFTYQDALLAAYQPFQNEFQRYPGHPAMVSLSGVFPSLTSDAKYPEDFYPATPRTVQGGSQEGTVQYAIAPAPASTPLPLSTNRLYDNLDDFFFQPSLQGGTRLLNTALGSGPAQDLSASTLEKSRFFLTAYSTAPDVNVFNLPRICMWPITQPLGSTTLNTSASAMTPFDKLIAFCETLNSNNAIPSTYYFQRQDPTSQTTDLPLAGSSSGLGRNRQLVEYLRGLMSQPFPGFSFGSGATFAGKYPADYNQILVELFDYIRSTNLLDGSQDTTNPVYSWPGKYAPSLDTTSNAATSLTFGGGTAQVVPIIDQKIPAPDNIPGDYLRGFGRFPTVHQAVLHFIGCGDANSVDGSKKPLVPAITGNNQRVQAAFYLQMFDPSQGCPLVLPRYQVVVSGLDGLQWNSFPMGFPKTCNLPLPFANATSANFSSKGGLTFYGGLIDYRQFFFYQPKGAYPCVSGLTGQTGSPYGPDMAQPGQPGTPGTGTFTFSGGTVTVQIFSPGTIPTLVQTVTCTFPKGTFPVPTTNDTASPDIRGFNSTPSSNAGRLCYLSYTPYPIDLTNDVIRAVVATPGDMRLVAARTAVPATSYAGLAAPAVVAPTAAYASSVNQFSHMMRYARSIPAPGGTGGVLVNGGAAGTYAASYPQYNLAYIPNGFTLGLLSTWNVGQTSMPADCDVPNQGKDITLADGVTQGDWDTGIGDLRDGSYINKADEGDIGPASGGTSTNNFPYYDLDFAPSPVPPGASVFSPNRMIPSAGMFGSLSTGVWSNSPWQTLLFRPGPALHPGLGTQAGAPSYPSSAPYSTLPDHLLLDLFHMPVVEPYAISKPLATSGRINMNYSIVPFTYINRDTGLRAAMKAQTMYAINVSNIPKYKTYSNPDGAFNAPKTTVRYGINPDATLSQFRARFNSGDIFRAASEICSVDLVPTDPNAPTSPSRTTMDNYWSNNKLTGDNLRERPYADLYPLLTTKSNVYTVYYEVQSLKQVPNTDVTTWVEAQDVVLGQYRGSQTFERYIDPTDNIPDYALSGTSTTQPLSQFYRFRTLSNRQFAP